MNSYLYERRSAPVHGDNAHSLVDLQVEDEDFTRVDQDNVMTAGSVVGQL